MTRVPACVFWLCCLLVGRALAADLQTELDDALDRGDAGALKTLTQPFRAGDIPAELSPLTCLTLGIALMDTPERAVTFFERVRQDAKVGVRAQCWLAEAYLQLRFPLMALEVAEDLRKTDALSPAAAYVDGRVAWNTLMHTHPKWTARLQPLRAQIDQSLKRCTDAAAQKHPHFDPRFFSLGVAFALSQANISLTSRYTFQFLDLRPSNAVEARRVLTIERDLLFPRAKGRLQPLERFAAFTPAEWDRWKQRFAAYTPETYIEWGHALGDESMGESAGAADLRRDRQPLFYLIVRDTADTWKEWRAAKKNQPADGVMPARGHRRFGELALTFARVSAVGHNPGFAGQALEYLAVARDIDPALVVPDDVELALSTAINDYARGVPFFTRELPRHLGDEAWLRRFLPVAEAAPLEVFRLFAQALAQANPALRMNRLLEARARVAEDGALGRYQAIFDGQPRAVVPTEIDWNHYRALLQDAAERGNFLDGAAKGPSAAATFDAAVERWHQGARNVTAVAEQHAFLLIRRAKLVGSLPAYQAAYAAAHRALDGGSLSAALVRGLAEIENLTADRRKRESQIAADDRALNARRAKEQADARRKVEERQKERGAYISVISERMRSLELDINYSKAAPEERAKLREQMQSYRDTVKNFCKACDALGLQKSNGEDCAACDGTGKIRRDGPGISARR